MAISMRNLGAAECVSAVMAATRTCFLLVGIVSTAVILASTVVPYSTDLLSTSLPRIRIHALAWLSPPYLFVAVHFIIVVIWKLQRNNHMVHPPEEKEESEDVQLRYQMKSSEVPGVIPAVATAISSSNPPDFAPASPDDASDPADPSRTVHEEAHDSMDATWKAIVEGDAGATSSASRPRMRKSDTWERCGNNREYSHTETLERKFRKSGTFRRVSVGREELFGRAEAFIRTQYEQRRIQRQESEQRYIEMVNAAC